MLNKYDREYKKYLALQREQKQINEQMRNLPKVQVEPFQKGWEVFVSLRDDILRRDDAPFLLELIDKSYHRHFVYQADKVRLIRKGEKGVMHRYRNTPKHHSHYESFIPKRKRYLVKQYEQFSEREKKYFELYEDWYNRGNKYYQIYFPMYWLKLKVKPNIVTEINGLNPDLESRDKEIDEIIFRKYAYKFWDNNYGGYDPRLRRITTKRETQRLIREYDEVFCQSYLWDDDLEFHAIRE